MTLRDIVVKARSYRRFREERKVDMATLVDIVDTARLVPSSVNTQPLRYVVSVSPEINDRIFPLVAWARLLKDWKGPEPGERPAAYIVIAGVETNPNHLIVDLGIASQTIFLALAEAGLAGCMLGNINAPAIHSLLKLPDSLKVLQVMAVGHPGEEVAIENLPPGGPTAYWRDDRGVHHVPKRGLDEVLLKRYE